MRSISNFREKCIRNCINYRIATQYRNRHPELTCDEAINDCRLKLGYREDQQFTLEDYCVANKIDIDKFKTFMDIVRYDIDNTAYKHNIKLDVADYIISYILSELNNTDEYLCNTMGLNVNKFKVIKRNNPEYSRDEIILELLSKDNNCLSNNTYNITVNNKEYTLLTICKSLNIEYDKLRRYSKSNNINIEEALEKFSDKIYRNIYGDLVTENELVITKEKRKSNGNTFKDKCIRLGLNYKTVANYRAKHTELSDEQVLNRYIQIKNKEVNIK